MFRKNQAVILVSTKHQSSLIDETSNKPMIIFDYYELKGILLKIIFFFLFYLNLNLNFFVKEELIRSTIAFH
jgi:hypothetical protein